MRFNVVTGHVEFRHAQTEEEFLRLDDHHENTIFRRLHLDHQKIPYNILHALLNSDFCPLFHPFKAYAKSLKKWDGKTDYIRQLCDTVQTNDDEYWRLCFYKWFVAYAVSLIEDDIINDTVVVFIGIQGVGKTRWMKKLVPPALKDHLGTAALQSDTKDTAIQLSECALIILDEMESMNRKDLSSVKELITRPGSRVRRPYGHNTENLPHRASFFGALNYQQFLTDTSGSRRFLCFKIHTIEYEHKVNIDGAFAQAYALWKSKFPYWFDKGEIKDLTEHNEEFVSKSIEEELIETWLQPVTRSEWETRNQFANGMNIQVMTASQIAIKLMEKAKIILGDNTLVKIGKTLHKLHYIRIRKKNNFLYMIRFIDGEVVDRESRFLEESRSQQAEQEENEQYLGLEEDLSGNSGSDELPF